VKGGAKAMVRKKLKKKGGEGRGGFPLGKSLLGVVLLGAAIGLGLAWLERRREAKEMEAILEVPEKLSPLLFPEAALGAPPLGVGGAQPKALPAAMEGLPVYPGSLPQGFRSAVMADGAFLEMAWFSTVDSVEQLRAFYEREFGLRGLFFVAHEFSPFAGYIGYMDGLSEELHLVSYLRQGGQTLVFPSRSKPMERAEGAGLPEGIPLHPQARGVKTVSFFEPEGGSRISYVATVEGQGVERLRVFYKEALEAGNWRGIEAKEGPAGGRISLEAEDGRRSIHLSFEQRAGDVRVYVLLMGKGPET